MQVEIYKVWLDAATNAAVTTPLLSLADWSTGAWMFYVGLHISASTPFFMKWLDYSMTYAVFKVCRIVGNNCCAPFPCFCVSALVTQIMPATTTLFLMPHIVVVVNDQMMCLAH